MSERYQRQTVLPGIGQEGQEKLADSHVVIVGCGGLGSPAAIYLSAAGVGHLRLIDHDAPELSNLHRQVFFTADGTGSKTEQLAGRIKALNPEVAVKSFTGRLDESNVSQLLKGADLVLDGTDDARTKHLVNDACVVLGIPLVYAAAQEFSGYVALFPNTESDGINLRDLYPKPDPSLPDCATTGVLPTAVGIIALLQANAALCYLLGIGEPPVDSLLTYSALDNQQHRVRLKKTYTKPISVPKVRTAAQREYLEIEANTLTPPGFDGIFSMLSEAREPKLPEGVVRLSDRDPLGDALQQMEEGGRYLVYCNSGKLSLVLAAQLRNRRSGVEVLSLRGGLPRSRGSGPSENV